MFINLQNQINLQNKINNQLSRAYKLGDQTQSNDLALIITNDSNIYPLIKNLQNYKTKKQNNLTFNKVLFKKQVYNTIDYILSIPTFQKDYTYNKQNTSVPTRWLLVDMLTDYIIED